MPTVLTWDFPDRVRQLAGTRAWHHPTPGDNRHKGTTYSWLL